jgi:hypothetical protein
MHAKSHCPALLLGLLVREVKANRQWRKDVRCGVVRVKCTGKKHGKSKMQDKGKSEAREAPVTRQQARARQERHQSLLMPGLPIKKPFILIELGRSNNSSANVGP